MRQFKGEYAAVMVIALSTLLPPPYLYFQPYILWILYVTYHLWKPAAQDRFTLCLLGAGMLSMIASSIWLPEIAFLPHYGLIISICASTIVWGIYSNKTKAHKHSVGISIATMIAMVITSIYLVRPFVAEVQYQRTIAQINTQNMAQTNRLLGESIKLAPKIPRYHQALSRAHIIAAETLARRSPLNEAQSQILSTYMRSAIAHAKETVRLAPASAASWAELGYVYSRFIGPIPDSALWARASYERAITLNPNNADYLFELARLHVLQNDAESALSILKVHTKKFPKDPRSPFLLGQIYSTIRTQDALYWYEKAMKLTRNEDKSRIKQAMADLQK